MVSRVDPAAVRYIDHEILELVEITDGDTVRAFLTRTEPYDEISYHTVATDPAVLPRGVALRLIYVQCPDYPDKVGKAAAKADTQWWFTINSQRQMRVRTWYGGGFGRYLADIYCLDADGSRHSLSQWLLTHANDGKGWPSFTG